MAHPRFLSRTAFRLAPLLLAAALAGCLSESAHYSRPTTFDGRAPTAREIAFPAAVEILLPTGLRATVPAGSRWRPVGRVPEGEVFRREDGVLMFRARQLHEAYLVISGARIVGLYLPVETAFVEARQPVPLPPGEPR